MPVFHFNYGIYLYVDLKNSSFELICSVVMQIRCHIKSLQTKALSS